MDTNLKQSKTDKASTKEFLKQCKFARFHRWLDISILALTLTVFLVGLFALFDGEKVPVDSQQLWLTLYVPSTFVFSLVFSVPPFKSTFTIDNLYIKYLFCYPPIFTAFYLSFWISAFIVHCLDFFILGHQASYTLSLTCLSVLTAVIIKDCFCFLLDHLKRKVTQKDLEIGEKTEEISSEITEWNLEFWLSSDSPVKRASHDLLDFDGKAKTIVNQVAMTNQFSIALEGEHGAGKSSLTSMIKQKMAKENPERLFVHIDSWGLSGEGVIDFILSGIIKRLEEQGVDCLAIKKLPTEYIAALNGIHKGGLILGTLLKKNRTTEDILSCLDRILKATGFRIVLCLEDVDRSDDTVMKNLIPLLDRFNKCTDTISFIFELTHKEEFRTLDHIKLFDYTEQVPEMPPQKVWSIFLQLFKKFKDAYNDIIVQHRNDKYFYDSLDLEPGTSFTLTNKRHIIKLVSTPRLLKSLLRRIQSDWGNLHGEVDLIELIAVDTLRVCEPEGFNFIKQNYDLLYKFSRNDMEREELEKANKWLNDEWKQLNFSSVRNERTTKDLLETLGVFISTERSYKTRRKTPLSIFGDEGYEYWERIIKGYLSNNLLKDQQVFQELNRLQHHGIDEQFISIVNNDSNWGYKIIQFRYQPGLDIVNRFWDPENLLSFFSHYHDYLLKKEGGNAHFASATSYNKLINALKERGTNIISAEWIVEESIKVLQSSLFFALEIIRKFYKCASGTYVYPTTDRKLALELILDCNNSTEREIYEILRAFLVEEFTQKYKEGDIKLEQILGNDFQGNTRKQMALAQLIVAKWKTNLSYNIDHWHFLSPELLGLIERENIVYVPQLFYLIFNQPEAEIGPLTFNKEYFEQFFTNGHERAKVANAFLNYTSKVNIENNDWVAASINKAKDELVQYLHSGQGATTDEG